VFARKVSSRGEGADADADVTVGVLRPIDAQTFVADWLKALCVRNEKTCWGTALHKTQCIGIQIHTLRGANLARDDIGPHTCGTDAR
jgi:hypothetical protein